MEGLSLGTAFDAFTCTRNSSQTSGRAWAQAFIRRLHSSLISLYCSKLAEVWTGARALHGCFLKMLILPKIGLWLWANDIINLGMLKVCISEMGSNDRIIVRIRGFPHSSADKSSACSAGDLGLIPGPGRSPGEGNGNPPQYSCLESHIDRGAWWATVHGVTRVGHDLVTKPPLLWGLNVIRMLNLVAGVL